MHFRVQKIRCAKFVAATLSVGLWLACGDDESSNQSATTSDAGEQPLAAGKSGSAGKPSAGRGGSSTMASGGKGGNVGEAGAGGAAGSSGDGEKGAKNADSKPSDNKASKADKEADRHEDAGVGELPAAPKTLKVSVRFKAKVGKADFACGQKYANQGSAATTLTPRDLRMFVYDLKLISANGTKVPVVLNQRAPWQSEKLALLDFEDNTGRCTEGNAGLNAAITGTVPAGAYTGISFVTGLPEELDHHDPEQIGEPLKSASSLRSGELAGFRFAKIELIQLGATSEPSGVGLLHLGSTECSGSAVSCAKSNRNAIELDSFDVDKNSIVLDVGALFSQLDLTKPQECHSTEKSCEPMFQALGLDFATGKPKDGQRIFRAE